MLYITGDISPTLKGLRITGGDAERLSGQPNGHDAGGGMYIITATATISNNRVFSNTAAFGGGLYLYSSAATLSGNTISDNTTNLYGGGLYLEQSAATLNGNAITSVESRKVVPPYCLVKSYRFIGARRQGGHAKLSFWPVLWVKTCSYLINWQQKAFRSLQDGFFVSTRRSLADFKLKPVRLCETRQIQTRRFQY